MVAARHLAGEAEITVLWYDSGRQTDSTRTQLQRLLSCSVHTIPFRSRDDLIEHSRIFQDTDLIIDALLGTGGTGKVREPIRTGIEYANNAEAPILSADLPSPGIISGSLFSQKLEQDREIFFSWRAGARTAIREWEEISWL